ncbi:hypothetical protein [Streptomyces sp. FZ201]|uniref:hypothetical protein n=1 Tax=Streptomyces sp. FZ201 TaxID=3057122 RepID=UPI0021BED1D8|nr:hypothetical protein [Streptomyces sp. FZ201]
MGIARHAPHDLGQVLGRVHRAVEGLYDGLGTFEDDELGSPVNIAGPSTEEFHPLVHFPQVRVVVPQRVAHGVQRDVPVVHRRQIVRVGVPPVLSPPLRELGARRRAPGDHRGAEGGERAHGGAEQCGECSVHGPIPAAPGPCPAGESSAAQASSAPTIPAVRGMHGRLQGRLPPFGSIL